MPFGRSGAVLTVATAAATTLLLAACSSDNTGPKISAAAQAASHYDSLGNALITSGTSATDTLRGQFAEAIAGVAANGVAPTSVTVTVNGSQTTWLGTFGDLVDSSGDSLQAVAFWSDPALDTYVWMFLDNGSPEIGAGTVGDGDSRIPSLGINPSLTFSASGACQGGSTIPYPDSIVVFFPFPTYAPTQSTCTVGTAQVSFAYTFSGDTTATSQLTSFSVQGVTVNGVRLAFASNAVFESHTVPAPAGSIAARLRSSPYRLH